MPDELSWYLEPPESSAGRPLPVAPTYRPPDTRVDPVAVAAAATGGVPLCPPLGIVLGAVALQRLRRSTRRGHRLARTGFAGGIAWSIVLVGVVAFVLWRQHDLAAGRDAAGHLVRAGRVATGDLRDGDCVLTPAADVAQRWVPAVPCPASHTGEVYDVRALGGSAYPGSEALRTAATAECAVAWQDATAPAVRASASAAGSALSVLVPTESGWAAGDRGLVCLLTTGQRQGALLAP